MVCQGGHQPEIRQHQIRGDPRFYKPVLFLVQKAALKRDIDVNARIFPLAPCPCGSISHRVRSPCLNLQCDRPSSVDPVPGGPVPVAQSNGDCPPRRRAVPLLTNLQKKCHADTIRDHWTGRRRGEADGMLVAKTLRGKRKSLEKRWYGYELIQSSQGDQIG